MVNDLTATALTAGTARIPNIGIKCVRVKLLQSAVAATTGVTPGDTFTFDLSTFGGTLLWDITGNVHTTLNSVVLPEVPSVTVAGTTLTVTVAGGQTAQTNSSKTRTYTIWFS